MFKHLSDLETIEHKINKQERKKESKRRTQMKVSGARIKKLRELIIKKGRGNV